ncbi:MAG: lasso peptide biosynthesis B2 protein [Proteobacteria bacterium]|nr:lasso peptide biosynthesis B2 protein [Pseudomonadota bacterium]
MSPAEVWHARLLTLRAMALLVFARIVVALVPFRLWRGRIGGTAGSRPDPRRARRLAAQVERGAWRLPIATKCLPRAIALSLMLRRGAISHRLVLAARPAQARGREDDLHAWIECEDEVVLGNLPGPWLEICALGAPPPLDNGC